MTTDRGTLSGFAASAIAAETKAKTRTSLGQSYPRHYLGELGPPLTIREVARLIGCSAWTVRQQYIPQGLPHLRSGPQGKLIFYRDQVVRWIVARQTKGATCK